MVRLTEDMIVARTRVRLFKKTYFTVGTLCYACVRLEYKIPKGERHEPRQETQLLGGRIVRHLHHQVAIINIYKMKETCEGTLFTILKFGDGDPPSSHSRKSSYIFPFSLIFIQNELTLSDQNNQISYCLMFLLGERS